MTDPQEELAILTPKELRLVESQNLELSLCKLHRNQPTLTCLRTITVWVQQESRIPKYKKLQLTQSLGITWKIVTKKW